MKIWTVLLGLSLAFSLRAFAGGGEGSGGGNGYFMFVGELKSATAVPKTSTGELFLPLGLNPFGKKKMLFSLDLAEHGGLYRNLLSVFPFKPIHWKDPAQSDPRLLGLCASLDLREAGPHCWALMNKVAQIRLSEPDFAEFLLAGMGKYKWVLKDRCEKISDQGPLSDEHRKQLVQLARRDDRTICINRAYIHEGSENFYPLPYTDFVALILHEVLYGAINPIYDNSQAIRFVNGLLFRMKCPQVGQFKNHAWKDGLTWVCAKAKLDPKERLEYDIVSDAWAIVQKMVDGTLTSPLPDGATKLDPFKSERMDGVTRDLVRFSLLNLASLRLISDSDAPSREALRLIDHDFEGAPTSSMFPRFSRKFPYDYDWLTMLNVASENLIGSTVFFGDGLPKGFSWAEFLDASVRSRFPIAGINEP